jgi:tartrate-resistant acid phosphatase type 5
VRRLPFALLAAAVAFALAQSGRSAEPQPSVALLAIGDFGVAGSRERSLGAAMRRFEAQNDADALVTLGDNDYTESPASFRAAWGQSFGWLRPAGVVVAGSLGNHDVRVQRGRYQFATLSMPGPYYRRKFGDVELFVLDSNNVNAAQTSWLERALASSNVLWKVAVLHHPAFTCGSYHSHPNVVRRWVPLFERYGVRLALSGHDHNYQRFVPRRGVGVTYVVHGGGAGTFYPITGCPKSYPRRVRARREHGWLYLVFTDDQMTGWTVNMSGRRTDRFTVLPEYR